MASRLAQAAIFAACAVVAVVRHDALLAAACAWCSGAAMMRALYYREVLRG